MRVLISGGSGFLGRALTHALLENNPLGLITDVTWLSRRQVHANANHVSVITYDELDDTASFDVVINLAGESVVAKRWSQQRKQTLLDSRLTPTRMLVEWMARQTEKPQVFLSSSAIGWYGAQGDRVLDEASLPHDEFQYQLCDAWETAARAAETQGIRTVIVRTGVVLHPDDGMLAKLLPPFSMALGGRIGSGKQQLSWISLSDWVDSVRFLLAQHDAHGVYNLTAPTPVTNGTFTKLLAAQLKRPAVIPVPSFVLTSALGEMATLLLDGQKVLPKRLLDAGYQFTHQTLPMALADQLG